jgi:uncharacterized protein YecT (DUF1311 family)
MQRLGFEVYARFEPSHGESRHFARHTLGHRRMSLTLGLEATTIGSALVVLLLMLPLTSVYAQAVGSDRSAITKSVDAWQIGSFEIGPGKCTHPDPDDMRPYTLCLAETVHDETERLLQRQFKITLKNLRAKKGARAALRLQNEQQRWDRHRRRLCASEASLASTPEFARADFTCLDKAADSRVAHLAVIANDS